LIDSIWIVEHGLKDWDRGYNQAGGHFQMSYLFKLKDSISAET